MCCVDAGENGAWNLPSGLTRCINWKRFIGVSSTDAHLYNRLACSHERYDIASEILRFSAYQIAPELYTTTSNVPPPHLTVSSTAFFTFSGSRTSTAMACASPPASQISLATVLMVEALEFGSGGKGWALEGSEVDLAATATGRRGF